MIYLKFHNHCLLHSVTRHAYPIHLVHCIDPNFYTVLEILSWLPNHPQKHTERYVCFCRLSWHSYPWESHFWPESLYYLECSQVHELPCRKYWWSLSLRIGMLCRNIFDIRVFVVIGFHNNFNTNIVQSLIVKLFCEHVHLFQLPSWSRWHV